MVAFPALSSRRLWPIGVAVLAALILLPGLGSYGFWEPQEMTVAERALDAVDGPDEPPDDQPPRRRGRAEPEPPSFSEHLVAASIDPAAPTEGRARLPLALLALATVLVTYALGLRLASARAGLIAALALCSFPLFLFQARQLESDLGPALGGALVVLGLVGLLWPKPGQAAWRRAVDGALVAAGAWLGYESGGAILGVVVPFGGVGLAGLASAFARTGGGDDDGDAPPWPLWIGSAAALAVALAAGGYLLYEVFTVVDAKPGDRALFGKTLQAAGDHVEALRGVWKPTGDPKVTFNGLFEQIALGTFPWVALAPIAVARLALGRRAGRPSFAGYLVFGWAALAWVLASILARKVGPTIYPALPAVAVGIGVWVNDLWRARARDDAQRAPGDLPRAVPLVGLFAAFAAIIIGKDIYNFPARFLSLHLSAPVKTFPEDVSLHVAVAGLGIVIGLCIAVGVSLRGDPGSGWAAALRRWGARGVHAAAALSVVYALFLAHRWTPAMSEKFSSRGVFAAYHQLREDGDALGLQGHATAGSRFYSGGQFEPLRGRAELIEFLQRPERVFALARSADLCALHREAGKRGFDYYVIDDDNTELMLVSNKMWHGEVEPPPALHQEIRSFLDENPLARAVVRAKPEYIQHPLSVDFDGKLELIGVDMPSAVDRGDTFEMALYYRVKERIGRNWKVFVHFDGGGVRFQGDHEPVGGRCGTAYWQPGDYIIDRFQVEAGGVTYPKTSYRVWTGLFVGSSGNWENMKALSGNPDKGNRVPIGTIRLQ